MAARLYVADGCGLCAEARRLIEPFALRGQVVVELVDIAADAELFRRYGLSIPVLELVGGPSLDWPFSRADLRRVLG